MKNIGLFTLSLSILITVVVGFFLSMQYHSTYQKRVEDLARYECGLTYRVEVQESENIKGLYPSEQGYQKCLSEKGL